MKARSPDNEISNGYVSGANFGVSQSITSAAYPYIQVCDGKMVYIAFTRRLFNNSSELLRI